MDAMELIYSGKVQGICIVASDCDYIGLAGRIQEAGLSVYDFGQRNCTMEGFAAACDAFVFLDDEAGAQLLTLRQLRATYSSDAASTLGRFSRVRRSMSMNCSSSFGVSTERNARSRASAKS